MEERAPPVAGPDKAEAPSADGCTGASHPGGPGPTSLGLSQLGYALVVRVPGLEPALWSVPLRDTCIAARLLWKLIDADRVHAVPASMSSLGVSRIIACTEGPGSSPVA